MDAIRMPECAAEEGSCTDPSHWAVGCPVDPVFYYRSLANTLINMAAEHGVIVTIEQQPLLPLAMGNYESVASTRLMRK
jgi:hypothetical protein